MAANPKFYGLSQYRGPYCYELSGKHFHVVLDDGQEFSLNFLDGENLQWAQKGKAYFWASYMCMKGDDTTYLVHFRPEGFPNNFSYNFVLDTEQSLVTMVTTEEGKIADWPGLMSVMPYFGYIKVPGKKIPTLRHHFSDRMVGHGIYWAYNPGMSLQHLYRTPTNIRADSGPGVRQIDFYREKLEHATTEEEKAEYERAIKIYEVRDRTYPMYDEPCFHVWIKENLNLLCFVEENQIYYHPNHQGGGGLLMLQEVDRLVDVGLSFNKDEYYMLGAYGVEEERHDPMMEMESPYDWSKLQAVPWIHWPVEHDQ